MDIPAAPSFVVKKSCLACGLCADICPNGAIRLEAGAALIGPSCDRCGDCFEVCPVGAITMMASAEPAALGCRCNDPCPSSSKTVS